ncbi:hypothetical protein D9M69_583190 [compost metagenome]
MLEGERPAVHAGLHPINVGAGGPVFLPLDLSHGDIEWDLQQLPHECSLLLPFLVLAYDDGVKREPFTMAPTYCTSTTSSSWMKIGS